MVRRTRAQRKTDDVAFPVRVKFAVPSGGLGMSGELHAWLQHNVGTGRYAVHSAEAIGTQAIGIYFVTIEDADAFKSAFPQLAIADGTSSVWYYSPYRRSD